MRIPAATLVCTLALAAPLLGAPASAWAKEPPACAAISFRPVAPGTPDGEQEAGLYKSKFASIVLKATVQGGQATDYFMTLNGRKPDPAGAAVPKSAEPCLQSKHVKLPVKTVGGACTGNRFRIVIDRAGESRTLMLFGLHGDDWLLCSTAKA